MNKFLESLAWEHFKVETKTVTGELTGIKNNKTMKQYKVTTEILEVFDFGDILTETDNDGWFYNKDGSEGLRREIIERNPDWFEPVEEVQEGDWIYSEYINRCFRVVKGKDMAGANRVIFPDDMGNKEYATTLDLTKNGYRKATTPEIEQALKEEAKRRGFVEGKTVVRPEKHYNRFVYREEQDRLELNGVAIYQQGEFAQIVDQTPTIEINGNEVEFTGTSPKVGCTHVRNDVWIELENYIHEFDIRIYREGEDITEQIKQVADCIHNGKNGPGRVKRCIF